MDKGKWIPTQQRLPKLFIVLSNSEISAKSSAQYHHIFTASVKLADVFIEHKELCDRYFYVVCALRLKYYS